MPKGGRSPSVPLQFDTRRAGASAQMDVKKLRRLFWDETDRERETDRQTDRETERQREREAYGGQRETDRKTEIERHRRTEREKERKRGRESYVLTTCRQRRSRLKKIDLQGWPGATVCRGCIFVLTGDFLHHLCMCVRAHARVKRYIYMKTRPSRHSQNLDANFVLSPLAASIDLSIEAHDKSVQMIRRKISSSIHSDSRVYTNTYAHTCVYARTHYLHARFACMHAFTS